ncbi:MAG TPA: FdhF/YdeP family oxidoreductase [Pseudomonadales bacterium]|nr:FdhF/YdeP family oxidoreductase [Pseudomonadales bacterium]
MAVTGGGAKKVLYTLATARRIGLLNSAKALGSHNACKACGLGMGGQRGGMTNELDEFPSVCNKSVQAQSTDIQAPIPAEVFEHPLAELRELSRHELEHLGRLGRPLHKAAGADRFREVDWDFAIGRAIEALRGTDPDRTFFYSSGRSSNEAGFLLQLVARLYGTNNISNCSYYCHQATGEALQHTIGTGTSTVELDDIAGCDTFFLIGANPASNHPRLLHKLIELRRRGGTVIVVNPLKEAGLVRFAAPKMMSSMLKGGDEIASLYLQPRAGTDIALFTAIAKAIDELGGVAHDFVEAHCTGGEALLEHVRAQAWDALTAACGLEREAIVEVARRFCASERTILAWGMGMTHHAHGVDNIEWISNLALLRGMVGRRHAGLLPLRGHSNVQGIGTIGVKPVLPDEVFRRIEAAFGVRLPTTPGLHTLASLEAAHAGRMDVALLLGGNLLDATPDRAWAEEAMARVGLRISLTTTLNQSHVHGCDGAEMLVLPVCARDEEPEPTTQESMFNYVRLSDGGIERIASVRSEVAILADLGVRLLPDSPVDFAAFRGHRRIREAIAEVVPGMEDLADIDVAKREFHVRGRLLHTPEFHTPDGRAHFVVPGATGTVAQAERPFTLMSIRSEGQFNSIIYEERDSYRGVEDRWSLLMNQQDALELGVGEGGRVDLASDQGRMEGVRVSVFDVPRGCVAAYYPEANVLCTRTSDPRSHTPQFKSVPVSIEVRRG